MGGNFIGFKPNTMVARTRRNVIRLLHVLFVLTLTNSLAKK